MRALLLLLLCVPASSELSAPRIGVVRDLEGTPRSLHGVAGAFLFGEPAEIEENDDPLPLAIEQDELVIQSSGVRLQLPEPVDSIECAASDWFVLRTPKRLYIVHTKAKHEKIYLLPEAAR